ncbi:MAG: SRPBCC family protein [Prolixibacteraceae bacterium]|jgi:uncharacterized protein YndB with AHSA1/START domain
MNVLITILIAVIALVILVLIVAVFLKKDYSVVREITVTVPKQEVFDYIKFLKNQDNFSKWALMDPAMKKSFTGTDGTVGFISAWESADRNVGKGEQEIRKIVAGERIDFELRFIKPFAGIANAFMTTESLTENLTKIRWGFDSKMNYPMNLMLLFMKMDKMIGNDFESGLTKLKNILEKG